MTNKELIYISATLVALLSSSTSYGQAYTQCRTIDFAELQSFNKEELAKTYCKNNDSKKNASDRISSTQAHQMKLLGFAQEYAKIGALRESQKTMADSSALDSEIRNMNQNIANCSAENERVMRALTSKNTKVDNCDPLTLANISDPLPSPVAPAAPQDPLLSEYCQAVADFKKQLDLGNPFTKEAARLNSTKDKMKKSKTSIPSSCST